MGILLTWNNGYSDGGTIVRNELAFDAYVYRIAFDMLNADAFLIGITNTHLLEMYFNNTSGKFYQHNCKI